MTLPYCSPEDIRRKLDQPARTLDSAARRRYETRAESASDEWDSATGTPMRTVRVGIAEEPRTWEYHDAHSIGGRPPQQIPLKYDSIVPVDRSAGDRIEIRTGRDSWDDVTDEEGDSWVIDYRRGQIKLYRFLINRLRFEQQSERFIRLSYRHGGLGGDRASGVSAALDADVAEGDTTLPLVNAARFPDAPIVVAVGTTGSFEYVRVTGVDRANDELTVDRGVRATDAQSHSSGADVQYSPTDVREAVAARAAELLTLDDDADTSIPDDGQLTSRSERADRFRTEWEMAAARYSDVMTL